MTRDRVPFSYRALQAWARSAIHVVYRRIEVTGLANVPTDRPVILAANHTNGLADIAVIVATVPRFPQFLAAASWWKSAPARVLFRLGGVVPVHRARDRTDTTQNLKTFEACHAALAGGAHIAIFPEGEMHAEPALLPLKTGAARIALGASAAGVRGVVIVPVGLVYEDRARFRSDVEICFGEPIEIDHWAEAARTDPRKAARDVTDLLTDRLAHVAVKYPSRAEADLLDRATELAADLTDASEHAFACRNQLRRGLASAARLAAQGSEHEYRDLATAVDTHVADLAALGVSSGRSAYALSEPSPHTRSRLHRELVLLGPPAGLGLLAGAPVVLGTWLATTQATHESWKTTTRGVTGTFLCPLVWTLEYAGLAGRFGRARAVAITAAGVAGGAAALASHERLRRHRRITWLDRALREQPSELAAARASREVVREQIASVMAGHDRRESPAW